MQEIDCKDTNFTTLNLILTENHPLCNFVFDWFWSNYFKIK